MQRWLSYFLVLLVINSIAFAANAWDGTPHRMIADIAYQHLLPDTRAKVDALTGLLYDKYDPKERFFLSITWMDRIRAEGNREFDAWHYINYPYVLEHVSAKQPRSVNALWALEETLSIFQDMTKPAFERAVALRFLVHLVGDIHQPFHAVNLFSPQFPNGDKGGNLFIINTTNATNLHSYWDSALNAFTANKLTDKELQQEFPREYFGTKIHESSFSDWASESYYYATTVGYDITYGAKPSKKYQETGQRIALERIVLAGYRLAELLNTVLMTPPPKHSSP